MKVLIPLCLMTVLVAACADNKTAETDMQLTCQLSKCVCAAPQRLFLADAPPKDVLWRENGDAYCPEGYQLKLAKE
jgi:hypothetical protein